MCGRFTRAMSWRQLHHLSGLIGSPSPTSNLQPHMDIRPTDPILIVRDRRGTREIADVRWGLVPPSFDDAMKKKFLNHNARSDKIGVTNWWTKPFNEGRRCLIPASGFYEWRDEGKGKKKTRFYITSKSGEPLTFAGLWEWNEKLKIDSATMICTDPNELMVPIHDRMPVILAESDREAWLAEPRADLLRPAPVDDLIAYPVRSDIKDDDPITLLI